MTKCRTTPNNTKQGILASYPDNTPSLSTGEYEFITISNSLPPLVILFFFIIVLKLRFAAITPGKAHRTNMQNLSIHNL